MRRLVAAEADKLLATRLWLYLLVASMGITALFVSLAIAFSDTPATWTMPLETEAGQRTLFAIASSGSAPLAAVLGAVGLTGEYRHRTVTATFLATPRRGRVVVAKLVVYGLAGAVYGLACLAVAAAITVPWLAQEGVSLATGWMPATVAGVVATVAIYGLIGVGIGALARDQAASVVGLLVYLFVLEPVLTQIPAWNGWTQYLPGPADAALRGVALANAEFLAPWAGGIVLAAYGLTLAAAGTVFTVRRDVT